MAQDLSQTIQEGLAQTLTDLLGIDAKFQETTQTDRRDLQDLELLQVNAEFEFDKLSTILKFMIPAPTASIIFNTMMGASEYDISDTIDDDTTDAMGEFVSNISGSLVTAFNAKEVEELGKAKFHIQHKEVLESNSLENIDTIYRFIIDLDETPLTVFINFDEQFLPFIEEITKTEPTPYPEEEAPALEEESIEELSEEDNTQQEEITPEAEGSDPESIITDDKKEPENNEIDNEEIVEEEDEEGQKKAKKMKLLIIIISSLIALILITFLTFYLMSSDEEEMTPEEQTTEQMEENKDGEKKPEQEELTITPNKTLKKIDFNIKDIDVQRLNGRLVTLTKYEILTEEELEAQRKEERLRLERLKQEEELKEFAKLNKEEPVKIKPKVEPKQEKPQAPVKKQKEPVSEQKAAMEVKPAEQTEQVAVKKEVKADPVETKKEELTKKEPVEKTVQPKEDNKLLFILTNNIKYTLFKSLVVKTNSSTARISMCTNTDGRTTILIGPFEGMEQQNKMDQLIKDANENIETTLQGLTLEEFNQRCNF